jgi:hypothetical protein
MAIVWRIWGNPELRRGTYREMKVFLSVYNDKGALSGRLQSVQ